MTCSGGSGCCVRMRYAGIHGAHQLLIDRSTNRFRGSISHEAKRRSCYRQGCRGKRDDYREPELFLRKGKLESTAGNGWRRSTADLSMNFGRSAVRLTNS